jgi:hypothetical protein
MTRLFQRVPSIARSLACGAVGVALLIGVAGCMTERCHEVPGAAESLASGNNIVSATAPAVGMMYVCDQNANKLDYSGDVHRGDVIEVDPMQNRITLNGRTVSEKSIIGGNMHRIFFQRTGPSSVY